MFPDCETEGSEKINILAKNSDNEKISQSALFMEKMNAFSDNTLLSMEILSMCFR